MDTSLLAKKNERVVVPMSEEQLAQLDAYAYDLGVSRAMAVRLILSDFFNVDLQKKQVPSKVKKAS